MPPSIDLTGQKLGRWTILRRDGSQFGFAAWKCLCECGNTKTVTSHSLRNGHSKSCGCFALDKVTTHGKNKNSIIDPAYKSWHSMMQRCTNPNFDSYPDYGGRGITVCDRWRKFENFYADMGDRPSSNSLDRINNNGNYEPSNCRWATQSQQTINQRVRADNTSGHKGVTWDGRRGKWRAYININGKQVPLGYYGDKSDAINAREQAEAKYRGTAS